MFRALFFSLTIVLISACELVDNQNLTEKAITEMAKEKKCAINLQTSVEYDKSKLVIKTDYPFQDKFEEGKFVLDVFKNLKSQGVYYDLIQLTDPSNGDTTKIINGTSLKKANRKRYIFLDDLNKLKKGKRLDFEKIIYNELALKTLRQPQKNLPLVKELSCNGMLFKNLEKEKTVLFRSLFGHYELVFGYSLKSYDNKIKYFQVSMRKN
ncbi:MAG: hypothetical protein P8M61_02455 [Crocinitomicaceae bacterium]|nr:hypothetical protein [Crocinitomicaceae bacterium]